jgi:hypothetical protein
MVNESGDDAGTPGLAAEDEEVDTWMFPTDDNFCRSILSDIPHSILPKLDKLLLAMHHSRQGHHAVNDKNAYSKTTRKVVSSKDGQPVRDRGLEADSGLETNEKTKRKGQKKKTRRRVREINPRDWSEVLGAAALTGWDDDAVKRAAARCSLLFGEDMAFATFEERLGSGGDSMHVEHASRFHDAREATRAKELAT